MQASETTPTDDSAPPAFVIRYTQSFDNALEAGRFFQARTVRWIYALCALGVLAGAALATLNLSLGLALAIFTTLMLLLTRFAVMDRLFGRRQARSVLDQPVEIALGDDGIRWRGPQATSHIPWASITEVRANARTVLFVRDKLLLAYAPAIAFGSEAEVAEVVAYARGRIGAAT